MLSRRGFLRLAAASLLGTPVVVEAQPAARPHRVGFLTLNAATPGTGAPTLEDLRQGLRELGYQEGRNLILEYRFADGRRELLPAIVREVLKLRVDVIVTLGTPATTAARDATSSVPIVFIGVGDPVGSGFAATLARPGGNLTGISFVGPELAAKNLELLKQAVPAASKVAVLVPGEPEQPLVRAVWAELERAAPLLRVTLRRVQVPTIDRLDEGLAALRAQPADALLTLNDPTFFIHRDRILAAAAELRLPTMFQTVDYVRGGALLAYAPSATGRGKRAASFVDKILNGANVADLAVEQPTRFELTINLKTAKALGLTIPPSLMLRANEVIQ